MCGLVAGLLCLFGPTGPIDSHSITPTQFHWNDYSDHGYITALQELQGLQREGLISVLGLCNFDAIRMDQICTTLGPRSIVSNQIQVRSVGFLPRQLQWLRETCPMIVCLFFILYVIYVSYFFLLYTSRMVFLDPNCSRSSSSRSLTLGHCMG